MLAKGAGRGLSSSLGVPDGGGGGRTVLDGGGGGGLLGGACSGLAPLYAGGAGASARRALPEPSCSGLGVST